MTNLSDRYANCTNGFLTIRSAIVPNLYVQFKAFITDFGNSWSPNWNSEEVFGRSDPIGMYKSTKRTLSLAWDTPAYNASEAKKNLQKCNKLVKMLYPAYMDHKSQMEPVDLNDPNEPSIIVKGLDLLSNIIPGLDNLSTQTSETTSDAPPAEPATTATSSDMQKIPAHTQTMAKPPLCRIKFANLIAGPNGGLLGWIDSMAIKPDIDRGYFVSGKQLYPKVWNINLTFTVLHEHDLGFSSHTNSWLGGGGYPFK